MTRIDAAWLAALRARADAPPRFPRAPLVWDGAPIGSVETTLMRELALPDSVVAEVPLDSAIAWRVQGGDLSRSLHAIALAMREAGVAHAWRDEQLAVMDESGVVRGSVERGVVRQLGVATRAVHLAGMSPDGRHWIQQRSLDKANDPGLWDTLMGGMVAARDSIEQALARETAEEAGLELAQLRALQYGGHFTMRRPADSGRGGWVVERLDWYSCVVPAGVVPNNRDGEVAQFQLVGARELEQRLIDCEFTLEAALILAPMVA